MGNEGNDKYSLCLRIRVLGISRLPISVLHVPQSIGNRFKDGVNPPVLLLDESLPSPNSYLVRDIHPTGVVTSESLFHSQPEDGVPPVRVRTRTP